MAHRTLLAGGYGNAGYLIADYLLREKADIELIIAGRNLKKAQIAVNRLRAAHPQASLAAMALDLSDRKAMADALPGVRLLILAASAIEHTSMVAEACLQAGTDYFDIQLSMPHKLDVLRQQEPFLGPAGRCFITDGGFHPGVLAALARYAGLQFDTLQKANIYAALKVDWSSMDVVPGTREEFMDEFRHYSGRLFQDGQWAEPQSWKTYTYDFGSPIGRIPCTPMYFEEMSILPGLFPSLRETGVFISGFNPITDYLVLPLLLLGLKLLPPRRQGLLARLFWWSLRFCKPPFMARLVLEAAGLHQGKPKTFKLQLSHEDAYILTAIPAVATLLQYYDGTARRPGLWFQGQVVEPVRFFRDMERMGIIF
ncbi:MAG: saccharopine dehydrogenase NADP-binding domain-containing protein [Phaeodactylibacter sp.]|nr:saccharopine dehydrogenase NADP-binding domain-containing protein [Phaeodactylibacter sp.]MCB9274410.1 saccharopine dehydrogenase NADP-binding domain-containing protein [Lewinellaceae bacterium]